MRAHVVAQMQVSWVADEMVGSVRSENSRQVSKRIVRRCSSSEWASESGLGARSGDFSKSIGLYVLVALLTFDHSQSTEGCGCDKHTDSDETLLEQRPAEIGGVSIYY